MTKGGRVTSQRRVDKDDERQSKLRLRATWPSASHRGFSLLWVWGLVFSVLGFFFFFLVDKQICIAILGNGAWFAFALYGLYLVFSTNDVTMDWFLICSILVFLFFFFFFLGENPWVCYLRITLGLACRGQWARLCYQFFFFFGLKVEQIIFFFFLIRGCS